MVACKLGKALGYSTDILTHGSHLNPFCWEPFPRLAYLRVRSGPAGAGGAWPGDALRLPLQSPGRRAQAVTPGPPATLLMASQGLCLRKNVKVLLEQTHQASPTTFQNPPVLLMFQFPVRLWLDFTGPFQDLLLAVLSLSQRAECLSHKFTPPLHNQPFDKDVFSH